MVPILARIAAIEGPDSDEIPRPRRAGLVRDNQTDLDPASGSHLTYNAQPIERAVFPEEVIPAQLEVVGTR